MRLQPSKHNSEGHQTPSEGHVHHHIIPVGTDARGWFLRSPKKTNAPLKWWRQEPTFDPLAARKFMYGDYLRWD